MAKRAPLPPGGEEVVAGMKIPAEIEAAFTDLIRNAAGQVWLRPALEPAQRSAITIAMLTALVRPDELRIHIGMGLDNGLSREQICEVILHCAIYAGFPAAVRGMEVASEAFAARDASTA